MKGQMVADQSQDGEPAFAFVHVGLPDMEGYVIVWKARNGSGNAATYLVAHTGYGRAENRDWPSRRALTGTWSSPCSGWTGSPASTSACAR